MKSIVTALAFTTVLALPVMANAATIQHQMGSSVHSSAVYSDPAGDFSGSTYVGQDPDSSIQLELLRDPANDR